MLNRDGDGLLDFDLGLRGALIYVGGLTVVRALEWTVGSAQFPEVGAALTAIAVGGAVGALTFPVCLKLDRVTIPLVVGILVEFAVFYALGMFSDPVKNMSTVAFLWTAAGIPLLIVLVYERRAADPAAAE